MKQNPRVFRKYSERLCLTILVGLCALLLPSASFAQLTGRPNRGYQAGNSYSISDIETVNLTGGNVSMNIPLASLPAGRGTSPGYGISLGYDSKLWNVEQEWNDDGRDEFQNPANYTRNSLKITDEGGWHLRYGYDLKVINRNGSGRGEACVAGNSNYNKNSFVWRVEMQLPDASVKAFRPYGLGTWSDDQFKDGFFEVDPNGHAFVERLGVTSGEPYCPVTPVTVTTAGMNYYSTDGSGVRLFIPYVPSGTGTGGRWQMYFPNGTVVENLPADDTSIFQRTTERNGNQVVLRGGTHNGYSGTKIEDQTGRFIFVAADANGDTKVFQSSSNGEQLETTVKWKEYWVYRDYRATDVATLLSIPEAKRRSNVVESFLAVDNVTLPAQTGSLTYNFTYYADIAQPPPGSTDYTEGWGELASVTLPSLAKAEYKYDLPENEVVLTTAMDIIKNSIKRKDLRYEEVYEGQTTRKTDTWLYASANGSGSVQAPDGGITSHGAFYKTPSLKESVATDWNAGLVFRSTNPDGSIIEKLWEQRGSQQPVRGQGINPYVKTEFTTIANASGLPSLTAIKDFTYDQNMNVLESREYEWVVYSSVPRTEGKPTGIPSGATLKRKTVNTYYHPTPTADSSSTNSNYYADPNSPRLRNVIKSAEIQGRNRTPVSRTEFYYDQTDTPVKGNLTETRVWDSQKGGSSQPYSNPLTSANSISSTAQYDQYGNPTLTIDAKGVQTQITYGDIVTPTGSVKGLYPTQIQAASNYTSVKRTSTAAYDFYSGLATAATDVDNNVSVVTKYDALGRPTKVGTAAGTPLES